MVNWSRYLKSLCNTYAQWWQVYTITDVVGQKRVEAQPSPLLFDFGLMVQTVERDREERGKEEEKVERLSVLEGLRKYASEHVLLIGRPGSGKSTALVRLLLEEAERCRGAREAGETSERTPLNPPLVRGEENSSSLAPPLIRGAGGVKIPVLVELRYYRTSILDLIQDFLQRHDPNLTVDAETLKSWLRQGQLLLLVDGLNELPSEEARRDLQKFRQDYQQTTPMIFTTRDLGVGGDLDIAKKLEMQPLTEEQMQQFVRAYLPEQGEQMLRQLGSRLRELGQTPLLLWMLCSLFKTMGKVPPNLGLVFRQFAQSYYDKLKQNVPVSDESRRWCQLMLQHLAWRMTQGREATELQVAISRQEAEEILTVYLRKEGFAQPRNRAMEWLADLLKYHLLQLGTNDQIEFRHQLIQEHCTAESLLKLLPSLSDDGLKREYLNYLKWTEPLALMLELVEDEGQAVRAVKLGLEVDLRLGARLAGSVKPELQAQTVSLVVGLEIPQLLKIQLLEQTKSEEAIPNLIKALEDEGFAVRSRAANALREIGSPTATPHLVKALKHEDFRVRRSAADALGKIGSEFAIPALIQTLNERQVPNAREIAAEALGRIGSDSAVPALIQTLKDKKASSIRGTYSTREIYTKLSDARRLEALNSGEYFIREKAATALGEIGSKPAEIALIQALDDEDPEIRKAIAYALAEIGSKSAIDACVKALNDDNHLAKEEIFYTLAERGYEVIVSLLTQALNSENLFVRDIAAKALAEINNESLTEADITDFYDEMDWNRNKAVYKLAARDDESAMTSILEIVRDGPAHLIDAAINVLGEIGNPELLSVLYNLLLETAKDYISYPISQIQERCKFYNYTLTQPILTVATRLMHILHLSDLHFGTPDQANHWSNQLAADLYNDINISHLDALILSGDIANYSTEEEYKAAEQFLHNLRQDFPLNPEQIILVPGNHDLNWKLAKKAYKLIDRDDYDGELKDGHYIEESASVIRVRDEEDYKQRFAHFSQFYETLKQKPYPLDYDQQATLDHLPEQNLLILGLNSAWQLDHHYKTRASINTNALSNALTQIRRNPDYKNSLKIAVWHHPLDSAWEDRITDQGFLEQLAVNGFRFFLHGHIHKAETSLFRYDMSTNGRKLDRICAGTFGAPVREWVPGYPLQYNLLKIADNQLTVYTRRREELNGAWKPDARWGQGAGKTPLDYYAIAL
jgi:HEAT repeat protein/3',5'-cyclic AMP phosphodiesterase CpdA